MVLAIVRLNQNENYLIHHIKQASFISTLKPTYKMKTFTQVARLTPLLMLCFFARMVQAQSIINPADTLVTYKPGTTAPTTPPLDGKVYKWVRTSRVGWDTKGYKCYIMNGTPFRVYFPKSYTTANDGKVYPLMVFFHGLGEAGPVTDNEISLYHGGDKWKAAVDAGTFDGYILVPQTQGGWGPYPTVKGILDYMIANNKVDRFHICENGLSAGAQGVWQFYQQYPTYISYIQPISGVYTTTDQNTVNLMKYTPIRNTHGAKDGNPTPQAAALVTSAMQAAGANYIDQMYTTLGHAVWDSTWIEPWFWPNMNSAYLSNPWPLYGRTQFCPGDNINVTMGVMQGLDAYQWRFNGNVISGATGNSIVATQAGTYDCRVQKNGVWSDWSHTPVTIVIQSPTVTPPIQVAGLQTSVLPGADGKTTVDLTVPNASSYTIFTWEQQGSSTVLGTSPVFTATQPGNYIVSVNTQYGCSSIFSPAFTVVNAKGPNPPGAVGNLVANSNSNTKVALSWSLSPNQTNPATSLEVYTATKAGGPYKLDAKLAPSATSYTDSLLNPNVKYFYVIRAVNGTAASALSNEANATTLSDTQAPTAPVGLKVTGSTANSISLAWGASSDNVGVTQYDIFINGQKSYVTSDTSFIASGLTHNNSYTFTVKAEDGSGNVSNASSQVVGQAIISGLSYSFYQISASTTTMPNYPSLTPVAKGISPNVNPNLYTNITTTGFGYMWQGYITIPVNGTYKFQTTSDDGSKLYFNSLTPTGTATVNNDGAHGSTTVTSNSLNLTKGTYPICIVFFNAGGGYAMSVQWICSQLFGNTNAQPIADQYFRESTALGGSAPARPTLVKATALAYNKIKVDWKDNATNEQGFEIYRATAFGGPYNIVATTPGGAITYTDSGLNASTKYYYRVQAINQYGVSGFDSVSTGGVSYKFYQGTWNNLPNFDNLTPVSTGQLSNVSLSPATVTTNYGFKYTATLTAPVTGLYTLYTTSDDGSALYIGSYDAAHRVVNNDALQGATQKSGTITLTAGQSYQYIPVYFQQGGDAVMTVQWKLPGSSAVVNVPDSAFANPNSFATTSALPSAPGVPAAFAGNGLSSQVIGLTWNSGGANISGFTIFRSFGDSTHFQQLASTAVVSNYNDSSLFGHSTYYYKLQANGPGGSSASTPALKVNTLDNAPVITNNAIKSLQYGTTATVTFTGNDPDGDALTYTGVNLPGFATLTDNGNGTATLVLAPQPSDAGNYTGIGVQAADGAGGLTQSVFTISINNNQPPVITPIANYNATTATPLSIPLTATDNNPGDALTFTVKGAPGNYSVAHGPNGSDTLKIVPNPLAVGLYPVIVTVTDAVGAASSDTFNVNVTYRDPSSHIYVRPFAGDAIGAPWNSMTGVEIDNMLDANGNATTVSLTFTPWWWFPTYAGGQTTGNNSGVYPDAVLKDYMWWGISGGPDTANAVLSGLDPNQSYTIDISGSATGAWYGGTCIYYVNGVAQTLVVQSNTTGIVTFNNVHPAADGTVAIKMAKGTGVQSGYWNSLVITSSYDDGSKPLSPSQLAVQSISGHGVQLNWNDSAYNASSYQVFRSASAAGPYTLLSTLAVPNATSYLDTPVNGNMHYYYYVNAVNAHGTSYNSDTADVTTANRIPVVSPIANVAMKAGQSQTVNITAVDDATDQLTLTASGLPAYASFIDNGNGTATITVSPSAGVLDLSQVTVTATDQSDSTGSASFSITVVDKDVTSTYLHFSSGPAAPAPWNVVQSGGTTAAGFSYSGFKDDSGNPSGITLTLLNGFTYAVQYGMRQGNGNGVYPDVVLRNNFFESTTKTDSVRISGLDKTKLYNFVFFASHDDGIPSKTIFKIGAASQTLDASYNTNKTVSFNGLTPDANGNIVFSVAKDASAYWCFLNSLIIQSYANPAPLLSPADLRVIDKKTNSITLQWQDRASAETGYEVWRSVNGGSYSLLKTLGAGVVSYKDSALTPNTTYFYTVRTIKSTTKSSYTSPVGATTYAYAIDINIGDDNNALAPWNNLYQPPQPGYVWKNFFKDEFNSQTSLMLMLNGTYAGGQPEGVQTGNNSGIYPDAVLAKEYITFPGQVGGFLFSNLNVNMKYDLVFMPSIDIWADNTTYFAVGNDTVIQSATLNSRNPVTMYGVSPDAQGNIQVWMALYGGSQQGSVNAIVVNGYTPSTLTAPNTPASAEVSRTATTATAATFNQSSTFSGDSVVTAFPNPFSNSFTLTVPAQANEKVTVMMYNVSGQPVFSKEFDNLVSGTNYLQVQPNLSTKSGIYLVRIVSSNGQSKFKVIKLMQN